jgi:hypothetical protein
LEPKSSFSPCFLTASVQVFLQGAVGRPAGRPAISPADSKEPPGKAGDEARRDRIDQPADVTLSPALFEQPKQNAGAARQDE